MKNLEIFIALRYIKKKKFQTVVSVFSIFISLTVFITSLVVSEGLKSNMINSILNISPHITIVNQSNYKDLVEKIEKLDVIATSNVYLNGFLRYKDNEILSNIYASELYKKEIKIVKSIESDDVAFAYIGQEMANNYGIDVGDSINVVSLNGREISLIVKAIFKTGILDYDKGLTLIPLQIGQILKDRGDNIDNISVYVKNPENVKKLNELRYKIENIDEDIITYTWAEENNNLLSAMQLEQFTLVLILSLLVIISSFIITTILNILVREKTRDIAILRAFGYSKKSIKKIFIYQGMIIGFLGMILSVFGSILSLFLLKNLFKRYAMQTYYITELPLVFNFKNIALVYVFAFLIIFIASYIPAKKAMKQDPVEAMKFNL